MDKMNGKLHTEEELQIPTDLLNPFVHRLELSTTYDKIKTGIFTVAVLPFRVFAIMMLLIMAWILACIGLMGLSEKEQRSRPMTGWRRDTRAVICWVMRALFLFGGFHWVTVKGKQASSKEAPVLALAPHSSYFDALPVVYLGAPSVVAKGETGYLPFFGTLTPIICKLGKSTYQAGGMRIAVKGRQASRTEAPILVVAPHSTFLDASITYVTGFPSIIVRRESGLNPFIGKLINYTQPVYVWREDPNSRQNTIKEIIDRATSELDWPQVLIFPEGTCTNRSCLITFKPGAFYPGVPIQPVCIRYPNKLDTVTWTWEGPGALKLLWLTLTQVHSTCEIEFLPVYHPNEDEKRDPKLFANNVRHLMAKALGVPVSDYTYDDCRLMTRAKKMNLPCASELVEVQKLRNKLGLSHTNIEERILKESPHIITNEGGQVSYREFAKYLELEPSLPSLQQLFKLYSKDTSGVIDFREYILGVLVISKARNMEDMLQLAFKIFDRGGEGKVTLPDLTQVLHHTMSMSADDIQRVFHLVDTQGRGYVTYNEFKNFAQHKAEYANIFFGNNSSKISHRKKKENFDFSMKDCRNKPE